MFKNVSFKVMLAGGNIIILVLLVIISTLLFTSINSLIASSKWVTHPHEVLSHASVLAKAMVDMETG
ncbi:MAG: chemotaxis protein, partial [Fibrobacterota bacterium]